jgi:hypothetical protein
MFTEIGNVLNPLKQMVESLAGRTHVADIKQVVGDYTDEERDAVITWVNSQPDYLQTAYTSVIEEGRQVRSLIW